MYCYNCMREIADGSAHCVYCGSSTTPSIPPHQLKPGTILNNKFMVGNVIGEGGFGITYVGLDLVLERKIAIKEFFPSGYANRNNTYSNEVTLNYTNKGEYFRSGVDHFLQEAKRIAKFNDDKSIVYVISFFEENNTAYIIMEYLDGENLSDRIRSKGKYEPTEIFRLFLPIMNTLDKMHRENIIHRDISPENVRVMSDGTLKLIDFGSARYYAGINKKTMSVQLKPGYAPFEQYNKNGNQGPWTDVYGLCATIYKCITGVTPVDSLERIQNDNLKEPSRLGVNINETLEKALMHGLEVYPENRCKSMLELKKSIENQLTNESVYKPEPIKEPPAVDENKTVFADDNITISDNNTIPANRTYGDTGMFSSSANEKRICNSKPFNKKKTIIIIGSALAVIALIVIILLFAINQNANNDPNEATDSTKSNNSSESYIEESKPKKGVTIESGTTGDCTWVLDENGLLSIDGNGKMEDYSLKGAPWYEKRSQIKEIAFGEGVTQIGQYSLVNCESISKVYFSNSITKINDASFYNCSSLKEINIPKNIASIGFNAFGSCTDLAQINVENDNPNYSSVDGNLFTKDKKVLLLYAIGKTDNVYTVPSGTTKIGEDAFEKSQNLNRIIIPDDTKVIGNWAFEYSSSLQYVEIPASVTEIGENAFEQCPNNITIICQSGSYAEDYANKQGIKISTSKE